MPGILIFEDGKELREMLNVSLARRKFTVPEAENGKDAIYSKPFSINEFVRKIEELSGNEHHT